MKYLTTIILVAVMAMAAQNVAAQCPHEGDEAISYYDLAQMLAAEYHWDEYNLVQFGLEELFSDTEEDEECGEFCYFVYGKNAEVVASEGWNVTLAPTGCHAFAIEVTLMTDNCTRLFFKEKADHDAFLDCARNASFYTRDEYNESIGLSLIESDEYVDGWYVISLHGG